MLQGLALAALVPALLIASCTTISYVAGARAENKAEDFCKSIRVDSDINEVTAAADKGRIFHYNEGNTTIFQFPAFLLSSFECAAETKVGFVSKMVVQKGTW
jgi:hypothetical protein